MKKILWAFLFLCISFLLQSTLLAQFNIGDITPNLLVITITALGFLLGRRFGLVSGFITGLFVDIFFGKVIGIYALLYMLVGYINGCFKKILFPNDIKLPITLIAVSDFAFGNVCYICFFLLKGRFNYLFYLRSIIMPELIYTTVLACVYYPLIHFIYKKIDEKERERDSYIAQNQ